MIWTWESSFEVSISLVVVPLVLLASVTTVTRAGAVHHPQVSLIWPAPLNLRWLFVLFVPLLLINACILFVFGCFRRTVPLYLVFLELLWLHCWFWERFLIAIYAGDASPTAWLLSLDSKKVLTLTWVDRLNSVIHFATNVICLQLLLNIFCYLLCDILSNSDDLLYTLKTWRLLTTHDLLNMLAGFFSFLYVELLQILVKLIYIWNRLVDNSPAVVFA